MTVPLVPDAVPVNPRADIETIALAMFKTKMLNSHKSLWKGVYAAKVAARIFDWAEAFVRERDRRRKP